MTNVSVVMYTTPLCGYCAAARDLLTSKGVVFEDIDVSRDPTQRQTMVERSGRTTVPQIFIDARHIGGYDDMAQLEATGELDKLLAGNN